MGFWYLGDFSGLFYLLAIGIMIWSLIVRGRLNSLIRKYSQIPAANITSRISVWIAIIGVAVMYAASSAEFSNIGYMISTLGIVLYSVVFLFYLVTLPIERNASKRGLAAMKEFGWVSDNQLKAAKKVLWAAGDTYAVALASSALTLLRLLLMRGRRRR